MLCGAQHFQGTDARARRQHHMFDSADQTAFHARCAAGAHALGGDVLCLLQKVGSRGETCIYGKAQIKNSSAGSCFFLLDTCIFRSMDHDMGNAVVIFLWHDEDLASA